MTTKTTRGIRNNNPGNIERNSANKWQGRMSREKMTEEQRKETRFEVFSAPAWGIRAMALLLINYQDKHGCSNVRQLIDRWAPPSENNTDAYVGAVAGAVGVAPTQFINTHEYRRMRPMIEAIIRHENGQQPYSADVIEEGLRLAGVVNPGAKPLVAVPASVTTAAATAAAAGGTMAAVEAAQQLQPVIQGVLPAIQQVNAVAQATTGMPSWLRLAIAVGVMALASASIYTWWRLRRARKAVSA